MTVKPVENLERTRPRLGRFEDDWAEAVLSWARSSRDQYWLAPRTPPPLTVEKILKWAGRGRNAYCLYEGGENVPAGYGEVNLLESRISEYWLGHLIVDPAKRGQGLGRTLTRLLLEQAFREHRAERVTLVVFQENDAAVRTYRSAGMIFDGYEMHTFKPYGKRVSLMRFTARAGFGGFLGGIRGG